MSIKQVEIAGAPVSDLVADFLARGGQIKRVAPGKARQQSPQGWNRRNDEDRAALGRAVG